MTRANYRQAAWSLALLLTLAISTAALAGADDSSYPVAISTAAPDAGTIAYLPTVRRDPGCDVAGTSYGSISIVGAPTSIPAAAHPDINLDVRGWVPVSAPLTLVNYDGPTDPRAPHLYTLFANQRVPTFSAAYQVNQWNWACGCRGGPDPHWPTTLIDMNTGPNEVIYTPDSGYDIGGGNDAMVLYASGHSLTLKYTREDNVVYGYTIHIEGICVEPDLLARYQSNNNAGRSQLPVVRGGQPLGRSTLGKIMVGVRDNGTFLDPRSRKDWWPGR